MIIELIVKEIKESEIILALTDGRLITWPKDLAPADLNVDAHLYYKIYPNKDLIKQDPNLAEDLLNKILAVN